MSPLRRPEKEFLLEIARRSIVEAVESRASRAVQRGTSGTLEGSMSGGVQGCASADISSPGDASLSSPGAFVTLHCKGRLRGCIGQIGTPQPLAPLIAYCARAAAMDDPRFRPVEPHELPEIEIELSILSALEAISPKQIEIGKHGLMVTGGGRRGVLLPQVATPYGWSAIRFLEETCLKAGLDRAAWRGDGVRIEAFTADVFSESQLHAGATADPQVTAEPRYSSST